MSLFFILAKIHCVSDIDSLEKDQHALHRSDCIPFEVIPRNTENVIRDSIAGNDDAFIEYMVSFAMVSCFVQVKIY